MEKEIINENKSDNQIENSRPWLWKKGQSGNVMGRPKGKTMKEYAKEYLSKMTDEERDEWLDGIDKETIWKLAEGNPETKTENKNEVTIITPLSQEEKDKLLGTLK